MTREQHVGLLVERMVVGLGVGNGAIGAKVGVKVGGVGGIVAEQAHAPQLMGFMPLSPRAVYTLLDVKPVGPGHHNVELGMGYEFGYPAGG